MSIDRLAAAVGRPLNAAGIPLTFIADAPAEPGGYEARIAACGRVGTRDACWHDLFNALVWLRYPRIKAAMNARHCAEIALRPAGERGPVRDALTQFDEDGLVLVSDDDVLIDALRGHRWREAMHQRRPALERARLHVIGHALLDKARVPHVGLCAKVLYLHADQMPGGGADVATDVAAFDRWLASRIEAGQWPATPRDLKPLPVLGLPGMTPDNLDPAYFDDTRQFRPARA